VTKTDALPQYLCMDGSTAARISTGRDTDSSFYAIYERELGYVWKTLGRLGVDPSELADAVHDVFVIVHRRWADIDFERPIRPWLFGIARRVAAGLRRKRRELPSENIEAATAPAPHPERDFLWRVLAELDDDRRDVIVLHDLEGYTGAEIAVLLDIPANTVHSRLRLGRQDMQATVRKLRGER
jgi:RNA polymerase sigma-70 factor (ECF subfamily)